MKKWIAIAFLFTASAAQADAIEMKVYGLVCGYCAQGIEKILKQNAATDQVVVSLENKLVAVTTKPGQDISDAELTRAITEAGYDVKGIASTHRSIEEIRTETLTAAK